MSEKNQKRKFFRIEYPRDEQPTLRLAGKKYPVLDVSEEGIRFELPLDHELEDGDRIVGTIDFCRRTNADIKGFVLRISRGSCVVSLERHLPLPLIMSEQRYLLANFKRKTS